MSVLFALALAAASARVESVALTTVQSQLAVRVVVSGTPGMVAVHREGDAACVSITDADLGLQFAGGRRFSYTPQGVEKDVLDRTPARLNSIEITATPSGVSLLVPLPPDASIDVRRDARGLLFVFRPASVARLPPPVATTPSMAAVSIPVPAPLPTPVIEPAQAPATPPVSVPAIIAATPPATAPALPFSTPVVESASASTTASVLTTTALPLPAAAPTAEARAPVTPDLARSLFPAGQAEAAGTQLAVGWLPRSVGVAAPLPTVGLASAQTAPPAPQQTAPAEPVYRLHAGDQLRIVIYFHPNLSQELQIRPDGRIAFPLAGDLVAAGRTPEELGQELTNRLERELRNADATVIVQRFADLRVYIGGEVNNPGVYPLLPPTTTLQALLQAGGAKRTGSLGSVFVIRNQDGAPTIMRLDLRQSKLGEAGTAHDVALQPLDVVFVPKTGIAKVNDFVEQYITKVIPATVVLGLNYNFGNFFLSGGK